MPYPLCGGMIVLTAAKALTSLANRSPVKPGRKGRREARPERQNGGRAGLTLVLPANYTEQVRSCGARSAVSGHLILGFFSGSYVAILLALFVAATVLAIAGPWARALSAADDRPIAAAPARSTRPSRSRPA